jgi:hypothetical protein
VFSVTQVASHPLFITMVYCLCLAVGVMACVICRYNRKAESLRQRLLVREHSPSFELPVRTHTVDTPPVRTDEEGFDLDEDHLDLMSSRSATPLSTKRELESP